MATATDPRDTLMDLLNGPRSTVRVASREAGERVKATAANPSAFEVEQAVDGGWQVRYAGRDS